MTATEILASLQSKFGDALEEEALTGTNPGGFVKAEALAEVGRFCRDEPTLAFDYLRNLSAIDWLIRDEKLATKTGITPHLELVYHLLSFRHHHEFVLRVRLPRWRENVVGQLPSVASMAKVWKIANWHEREIFDLMGIEFTGHPELTRILCHEDWVGHPLRKDYEFPEEFKGIRCR